jgi:hypothetical protein
MELMKPQTLRMKESLNSLILELSLTSTRLTNLKPNKTLQLQANNVKNQKMDKDKMASSL